MEELVELVMTVPEPHNTHLVYQMECRTTLGVLVQLINNAEDRIIISAPFIQSNKDNVVSIIINAISLALQRGVYVDFLSTGSNIQEIKHNILNLKNLKFFQTSANSYNEQIIGSHAKFCVADGKSAYIGSANLTSPGLIGQLELGLLVHGGIAHKIEDFWDYLIELGLIVII